MASIRRPKTSLVLKQGPGPQVGALCACREGGRRNARVRGPQVQKLRGLGGFEHV